MRSFIMTCLSTLLLIVGLMPKADGQSVIYTAGGPTLAAQINAADVALGSNTGTVAVPFAGTISFSVNLSSGHNLRIEAPIVLAASIVPSGNNAITCANDAAVLSINTVAAIQPASTISSLKIRNCSTVTSSSGVLLNLLPSINIQNLEMENNVVNGGPMFVLQNGTSTTPTDNLMFTNNTITGPSNFGITFGGAVVHVKAIGNHFTNVVNGLVMNCANSATLPNYATIYACGAGESVFMGNTCLSVTACLWGGTMHGVIIANNVANGCADTCYDLEGAADSKIEVNYAINCGNFCASEFFTAFNNQIINNSFVGAAGGVVIGVKNSSANPVESSNLKVMGNSIYCIALCTGVNLESQILTTVQSNTFKNATFNSSGHQSPGLVLNANTFTYDVATSGAGLSVDQSQLGYPLRIQYNLITSLIAQAAGTFCISSSSEDFNNSDPIYIVGNNCSGWPSDIQVINNGGNAGVFEEWIVRNNDGLVGPSVVTSGAGTAPIVYESGNCTFGASTCDSYYANTARVPSLESGTPSNANLAGNITLSSGSGTFTFSGSFLSPPVCVASDNTSTANAVQPVVTLSGTTATLTLTGTGSDIVSYICAGRN